MERGKGVVAVVAVCGRAAGEEEMHSAGTHPIGIGRRLSRGLTIRHAAAKPPKRAERNRVSCVFHVTFAKRDVIIDELALLFSGDC